MQTLRRQLQAQRAAAIDRFRRHHRPDTLLGELRRSVDQALRQLVRRLPLPPGATLAAVGGYGRGELYPYSDVDVLILLPAPPSVDIQGALGTFVAALWDLGLEPGYSVRTIADCEREADADISVQTSLFEARWLAGSRSLMQGLLSAMHARLDARRFFQAKQLEMQQRHARYQDTPYALEPHCKESPGGLRDLQVILWMARAAGFGRRWREIARAGLLTASEARDLRRAEQAFKRLRIELHLLAGRREDRVLFDLQAALAHVYGITGRANRRASEILMQRYYWAARLVTQLNVILVQNIQERLFAHPTHKAQIIDADFRALNGRLDVRRDDAFARQPALLLRVFLVMQQHPELSELSARTLRAIWHQRQRINHAFRHDPANRRLFLAILQQPQGIVHALRHMTMLNILPRYLPAFRRIVGQLQHDLFHIYTVDQHTLAVIRNLRRFTLPEHAQEYPLASQLAAHFKDFWLLYVAALFHDIAKGRGGDHSVLGARAVRRFARDHALNQPDSELLTFLVRHHLLMSTVAQKRDLSDPTVIRAFTQLVGNERRLTALYLLTVADIRGTNPKIWNAWKGKLLEDLFQLARAVLGERQASDASTVLALRLQEAARLLRLVGLTDEAREGFWQQLDVAYFLRHDATEIAWHTRHLHACPQPAQALVKARPIKHGAGIQVMVCVHDQRDLFQAICGYFGTHGMDVQDARIHTTRAGWALDSFVVLTQQEGGDPRAQTAVIEHGLAHWLRQAEAHARLPGLNRARQALTSRQARLFPVTPHVALHPDERNLSWRLSVVGTNRPGLLYALAQTFSAHDIDLQTAKIMTLGDRVEDVFIISGSVLEQTRSQLQFERAVLQALDPPL